MNKPLSILCSAIAGVTIELILFYIWSAFEDETHVIIGCSCFFAVILFFGIPACIYSDMKKKQKNGIEFKGNPNSLLLYTSILCTTMILTALVLYAKDIKDERAQYEKREYLRQWTNVSEEIDKETDLAIKAQTDLSQAKSHRDEATLLAEYISAIDFNSSVSNMTEYEISAYYDISSLKAYFHNIEDAQTYYDEGKYKDCIEYSKSAIKVFQKAKDAYIGYRGSLDKYRL